MFHLISSMNARVLQPLIYSHQVKLGDFRIVVCPDAGEKNLSLTSLAKLAKALKVTIAELVRY
ncbi:MAG: hypothetical protein DMG14_31930 [Acidobacteria bacterium]|nr:MAG: hypothetical protein DMG14_31930 [Acidobacteriota bacterium]